MFTDDGENLCCLRGHEISQQAGCNTILSPTLSNPLTSSLHAIKQARHIAKHELSISALVRKPRILPAIDWGFSASSSGKVGAIYILCFPLWDSMSLGMTATSESSRHEA